MQTRSLGRCGLEAGVVGLGCEHLQGQDAASVKRVVDAAIDHGINILDVFMSEPNVRNDLGTALAGGKRQKVLLQGHIGAAWLDGQYTRTRDPKHYRHFFEDFMKRLQTDYVDIGMLHFIDTRPDYQNAVNSGMIDYAVELKKKGVIRAVGVSSHDPDVARLLVESGKIDVLMFSLNPAFDGLPPDVDIEGLFNPETYTTRETFTIAPEREQLYQLCEASGVGITVMKALAGGTLLDARKSPFGVALTASQCIHYALTRPAVASVMVGCRNAEEVEQAVAYLNEDPAALDYAAVLAKVPKFERTGRCMYCNHCLPCPSGIDIAQVNKYLDLAELPGEVPGSVRAHYASLPKGAADCIACGQCEPRCPFGVPVVERMRRAEKVFG